MNHEMKRRFKRDMQTLGCMYLLLTFILGFLKLAFWLGLTAGIAFIISKLIGV